MTNYILINLIYAVNPGMVSEIFVVNGGGPDAEHWVELTLFADHHHKIQSELLSPVEAHALVKRIVDEAECPAPGWSKVWHKPTIRKLIEEAA